MNVINAFVPNMVAIGGGISEQGDNLILPLTKFVNEHIFVKNINYKVNIVPATLGNTAGILGARCLFNKGE